MRLPILLYRLGLGFILGRRLVMIEHLGRSSAQRRFVVVECVDRTDSVVRVVSGFGRSAQWYRNIAANGVAFVSSGGLRRVPATPRLLTQEETDVRLQDYQAAHPVAWRHLESAMRSLADGEPEILMVELAMHPDAP